jgi:hypothetical protein
MRKRSRKFYSSRFKINLNDPLKNVATQLVDNWLVELNQGIRFSHGFAAVTGRRV